MCVVVARLDRAINRRASVSSRGTPKSHQRHTAIPDDAASRLAPAFQSLADL
jgi:hypothetical protein